MNPTDHEEINHIDGETCRGCPFKNTAECPVFAMLQRALAVKETSPAAGPKLSDSKVADADDE